MRQALRLLLVDRALYLHEEREGLAAACETGNYKAYVLRLLKSKDAPSKALAISMSEADLRGFCQFLNEAHALFSSGYKSTYYASDWSQVPWNAKPVTDYDYRGFYRIQWHVGDFYFDTSSLALLARMIIRWLEKGQEDERSER